MAVSLALWIFRTMSASIESSIATAFIRCIHRNEGGGTKAEKLSSMSIGVPTLHQNAVEKMISIIRPHFSGVLRITRCRSCMSVVVFQLSSTPSWRHPPSAPSTTGLAVAYHFAAHGGGPLLSSFAFHRTQVRRNCVSTIYVRRVHARLFTFHCHDS